MLFMMKIYAFMFISHCSFFLLLLIHFRMYGNSPLLLFLIMSSDGIEKMKIICEKFMMWEKNFFLMNNKWILISHETFSKQQKYVYLSGLISNQDIWCKYVKLFSSSSFFKFLRHLEAAKRKETQWLEYASFDLWILIKIRENWNKEENYGNKKLHIKNFNKTTCINLTFMLREFVFIWECNSTCFSQILKTSTNIFSLQ